MQIPTLSPLSLARWASSGVGSLASSAVGTFADLLGNASGTTSAPGTNGDPEALRGDVRALTARIRGVLADEGVTLSQPLNVVLGDLDRIRVVGNHPQAAAIESALSLHPEIGEAMRDLAGRLLGAGTDAPGIPIAYEDEGRANVELGVPPRAKLALPRV